MTEQEYVSEDETPSLVDWSNPPSLMDLKQDYSAAKPDHDTQKTKIDGYLNALEGTGKSAVKVPKGNSAIVPKLIRKLAEWRYPALSEPFLSSEDIFNVRPVSFEDKKAAHQNELVLNNQFNTKINKVNFIDEYVRTVVDEGTVIVEVGWEFEEEDVEKEVPIVEFVVDQELLPLHQELATLYAESPSEFATDVPEELKQAFALTQEQGVPVRPIVKGTQIETVKKTIKNAPTVTIRNSKNIVIDPSCEGDLNKAKFVIHFYESSLSELKKAGKYKNLDKINLETNSVLGTPDYEVNGEVSTFNFKDKARQKIVVYEYWGYWDINGDEVLKPIVAAWVGNTLIRMEENPFPDQAIPFVVARYLPIRKSVYGEPDGALLEDNQRIVGAVTRGMIDIMGKSANGQTGMAKNMLDATNKRKFENGQDYEFNPGIDPRVGVYMHTYQEIPNSAPMLLQQQILEAESMTGVKTFNQGITSQSLGDVAVGIRNALDAASKRELGILRRLAQGIVEIGRKIIAMNAEFLSDEEVVRITNEEFVRIRRDDLPGNFDLRLSISTPEEDNNRAEQLAFLLQTTGPNGDPELSKMILSEICRLRKMPELAKQIESFQPQPDPVMQERAVLENEVLRSQVMENTSRGINYQAQAKLQEAKIPTEVAKAENISAQTDQNNLDFVEQELGVKQERDMERQGAQARAQTEMKMAEHALNMERDAGKQRSEIIKEYVKQMNKAATQ